MWLRNIKHGTWAGNGRITYLSSSSFLDPKNLDHALALNVEAGVKPLPLLDIPEVFGTGDDARSDVGFDTDGGGDTAHTMLSTKPRSTTPRLPDSPIIWFGKNHKN